MAEEDDPQAAPSMDDILASIRSILADGEESGSEAPEAAPELQTELEPGPEPRPEPESTIEPAPKIEPEDPNPEPELQPDPLTGFSSSIDGRAPGTGTGASIQA